MKRLATTLALVGALALPASASSYSHFRTPSHNIYCAYFKSGGPGPFLRCDVESISQAGFVIYRHGKAKRLLISDSVYSPHAKTLKYGHSHRFGRFTCKSRKSGLTCKNRRNGHGFKLSREHQKLF
ncbi:MAG: DUF6636 domain-containing protein [Thermoleophilaceae bacterium]|jgi:hypothetical protein